MQLQIEDLHHSFDGVHVLRGVDLQVAANEIHAVIGPNGAGKTTLVAQLSGQIKTARGRIFADGKDLSKLNLHQRARYGFARSFQITNIILPLTLLENVMLAAAVKDGHAYRFWSPFQGDEKLRKVALGVLEEVGLAKRSADIAAEISHGEQRQLELAIVLALQPKLLLLDEPMAGIGHDESARMTAKIESLKGRMTVVLVEHDMDTVFNIADTISVLVDGKIIASGSGDFIRNHKEVQRAYLGEADVSD